MISTRSNNAHIIIEMNENEALVLYEILYQQVEKVDYQHYAEKKILLQLQGVLEAKLSALFSNNFLELLERARKNVQGDDEPDEAFWRKARIH